ncbi:hypothetical protein [Pseudooceanicola algae]|uniref:Uncharacterized protein n=1 Tax=Pseudooceanicola algae TaxID=1537215 RepID=A0A418SJD5_9RHOB|nr:hypothetical protein [Pseudooceanicola algae]QPM91869.1 hypothetical protein PSAL_031310 [Pseudooceanicola algae]
MKHVRSPLLLALALGLAVPAGVTAIPAEAQIWLPSGRGPAYKEAGFTRSQMRKYAQVQVNIDQGMTPQQAVDAVEGIDAKTVDLIGRNIKGSPSMKMTVNQYKQQIITK